MRKNSTGNASLKAKRFGSIGIISEDDEFNNANLSIIKSKEPLNCLWEKPIEKAKKIIEQEILNMDYNSQNYSRANMSSSAQFDFDKKSANLNNNVYNENFNWVNNPTRINISEANKAKATNSSPLRISNTECSNKKNENLQKKHKNIFPNEKRVTIDLAESIDKQNI